MWRCAPSQASSSPARRLLRGTVAVWPLLLEQRIELVEAQIDLPQIELTRERDGKLVLSFAGQLAVPGRRRGHGWRRLRRIARRRHGERRSSADGAAAGAGHGALARVRRHPLRRPRDGRRRRVRPGSGRCGLAGILVRPSSAAAASRRRREAGAGAGQQQLTIESAGLLAQDFKAFAPDLPLAGPGVAGVGDGAARPSIPRPPSWARPRSTSRRARARSPRRHSTWRRSRSEARSCTAGSTPSRGGPRSIGSSSSPRATHWASPGTVGESGWARSWPTSRSRPKTSTSPRSSSSGPARVAGEARAWIAANVPAGRISNATLQIGDRSTRPDQPDLGAVVHLQRRPAPLPRHVPAGHRPDRQRQPCRQQPGLQAAAAAGPARSSSPAATWRSPT